MITLNLLRNSRVNPRLSSYAYLFGTFDYNKTPLGPPGCKVVIYEKPSQRNSWDFHGKEGFYIGPSLDHYRCVKVYLPTTKRVRDADTVKFFPKTAPYPNVTMEDFLQQSVEDIITILNKPLQQFPSLEQGNKTKNAISKMANMFQPFSTPTTKLECVIERRLTKFRIASEQVISVTLMV